MYKRAHRMRKFQREANGLQSGVRDYVVADAPVVVTCAGCRAVSAPGVMNGFVCVYCEERAERRRAENMARGKVA